MPIDIDTLPVNATLAGLQNIIRQKEELGFELVTFARGLTDGQPNNMVSWRIVAAAPAPVTLEEVGGLLSLDQQRLRLNTGPNAAKTLLSYASVFVQANETNVAVYR